MNLNYESKKNQFSQCIKYLPKYERGFYFIILLIELDVKDIYCSKQNELFFTIHYLSI